MTASTIYSYSRLFLIATLLTTLFGSESQLSADVSVPVLNKGKGEQCVAPVEIMRRDHMKILFTQRDRVVLGGIRNQKESLSRCIFCHVQQDQQGKPIPINASGQFCEACHAFTGVQMDCFQCHATVPDPAHRQRFRQLTQGEAASLSTELKRGEVR